MPALAATAVSKKFGDLSVLKNVNFAIQSGEARAIIGPNGAGKTTLINIVSGVFAPTSGTVSLGHRDITGKDAHEIARLGLVRTYQITSLFSDMTASENVEIALIARKKYRADAKHNTASSVAEILKLLHLEKVASQRVHDLSHGDQRLLEVAVALAFNPEVILLDEPTAGMSPAETRSFIDLMNTRLRGKHTIVLVEHDMDVVMRTTDRVCVLANGEVIADDTPSAIADNKFVKEAYLGHS